MRHQVLCLVLRFVSEKLLFCPYYFSPLSVSMRRGFSEVPQEESILPCSFRGVFFKLVVKPQRDVPYFQSHQDPLVPVVQWKEPRFDFLES